MTNNDDKTGYDEDLDEEDSKSQVNNKKSKKSRNNKAQGNLTVEAPTADENTDDPSMGIKARKGEKENPRMDFVNDFFKQNLNPGSLNPNFNSTMAANKKDLSSSKIRDPHKNSFMTEWQNEILRNLQDTNK